MNICISYLSPAYKVMFVLITTVSVSPREPEEALFGRDVNTCVNKMILACHICPNKHVAHTFFS